MKITKEQEARILELDPNFFNLEVGKWYKNKSDDSFIVYKVDSKGYGINGDVWSDNWSVFASDNWVSVSDKEVKDSLVKEAKRRGYTTENTKCLIGMAKQKVTGDFTYESDSNRLYSAGNGKGGKVLFENGKWAEVIEKPTEKSLMEEAKERGFVKGVYIDNTNIDFAIKSEQISDSDSYYLNGSDVLCIGGLYVYSKGKWAEIVQVAKYYKNSAYLFKVAKGYCIQVCTYGDRIGIQRTYEDIPECTESNEATKEEFEEGYKLISERLKNLTND